MARGDIRYHSGPYRIIALPLKGSETFTEGSVVRITSNGTVAEAADDPAPGTSHEVGLALQSGDTGGTRDPLGTFRIPGFGNFNPSNPLPTTNDKINILVPLSGCVFIGKNKAGTYAQTDVGDTVGFDLTTNTWTFDSGATNFYGRVIDVLDVAGSSITSSGGAGIIWLVAMYGGAGQIGATGTVAA